MCTVTWTRPSPAGRTLICSRDEQRTRPIATLPSIHHVRGVRVLAPIDPRAGGTWLLANECGLVATLLNFYEATPPPSLHPFAGYRSRGLLLLSLGGCRDVDEADSMLGEAVRDDSYAPFWILALTLKGQATRWRWDGQHLHRSAATDADQPMTTSSWQTEDVLRERASFFRQQAPEDVAALEAYHQSCSPKGGPWGPCMARSDARTVSLSRIDLTPQEIRFSYRPRRAEDAMGFEPPSKTTLPLNLHGRP